MVVLKKLKSATLLEALLATVLIVVIFVIASLVLNNLVLNTISKSTSQIDYRLNELDYSLQNDQIQLPYRETYEGWDIVVEKKPNSNQKLIGITAINQARDKVIIKNRIDEK
jgi:predicted PurR-regulated permease PerM